MNNPVELIQMIKNPEQFAINYAKQMNNPIINNLIQMAKSNDKQGIETFARNLFSSQGINFDELLKYIKQ